jgi:dienelactone hydrolase
LHITPRFWLANRVTPWSVDLLFHVASAGVLSEAARQRFIHAGIDPLHLDQTLRRIRALDGWAASWLHTARAFLREARRADEANEPVIAAERQASAALCYHFAQIFERDDFARKAHLARRLAELFQQAAPNLALPARRVAVPWRGIPLPGYLVEPNRPRRRRWPLIVLLNGASTVKEETIRWSRPFVSHGLATLSLDTPGSGEAWERVFGTPDQTDLAESILGFAREHPDIDENAVILVGISLRGALAVQLGAVAPELAGVAAVTAPFKPEPYLRHLSMLVREEVALVTGASIDALMPMAAEMSLEHVAPRLRVPLFVVGAGNDLVVPSEESLRLYRAAGGPKQLLYLEQANHVGISHLHDWTSCLASWAANAADQRQRTRSDESLRRIA